MSRRKTTGNKQGKNENGDFESQPNQKMTRSVLKAHTAQTRNNEVDQSIQSHPSTYSTSEIMSNSENELHHFDSKAQSTDHISEDSNRQSMTESMKNSHLTPDEESKCRQAAEEYISNCKFYNVPIDPSVVIALQTGWKVLQPTSRFTEGSMLPLKNILEENNTIRKLNLSNVGMQDSRFRQAGNGNANARILNFILQRNKTIEELDLSNNGLDDDGIREICDGLKENQSIKKLNLSRNHFGVEGTNYLNNALSINQSIHDLDLSRNALGYHSINSLLCICGPRKVQVVTQGNYVFEEILNSVSHGVAFIGSVVGAFILIADATDTYSTDYHFWSSIIYSFALMFLFLSSCLFHSFFMLPSTMRILQILDHVGIYLVIAGTYTPFLLVALHKHTSATVLLIFEWIAALLGIFFATCSDLNNPNTTKVELSLFLGMGLGVVMVGDLLWTELSKQALILLLVGGGLYIVGIAFFILGEYRPIYHVVWHLFVVVAACAHWFAVYFFVLQVSLENTPTRTAVTEFADSVYGAAEAIDNLVNRTLAQMH